MFVLVVDKWKIKVAIVSKKRISVWLSHSLSDLVFFARWINCLELAQNVTFTLANETFFVQRIYSLNSSYSGFRHLFNQSLYMQYEQMICLILNHSRKYGTSFMHDIRFKNIFYFDSSCKTTQTQAIV